MMKQILHKLTSRKLWLAVAGLTTGIAMAFGVDEGAVGSVAGSVTAAVSVVAYILAEGRIDAASIGSAAEHVQDAASTLVQKNCK